MTRYWDDPDEQKARIYEGLVIQDADSNDLDAFDWIRRRKGWD